MKDKEEKKTVKKSIILRKRKKTTKEEPNINKQRRIKIYDPKEKGVSFSLIEVVVIIVITGLIVSVCSGLIVYNNYDKFSSVNSNESETDLSEFIESYNHILKSYVKDVDRSKLLDAAIEGMYDYLNDAYSIYIDEDTTESLNERLEGKYQGIGIEISMDEKDKIYISRIFSDTPAEKAGLKKGDIITSIDGKSFEGKTSSDVANTIKESEKSSFEIGYIRDGKSYKVTVQKTQVFIDSVSSKTYDNIGYIRLETFSATSGEQVNDKLNKFDSKINKLIIDLRSNTGGYLSAAYETANMFLDSGKVIYQLKSKDGSIKKKLSNGKAVKKFDNIVVLINESTASASEILAAALKDNLNAQLVGKVSFGKGTVQETEKLSSGAMVKYTSAYWLTPKGESIDEVGLPPNYDVEENYDTEADEQLNKALEVLK